MSIGLTASTSRTIDKVSQALIGWTHGNSDRRCTHSYWVDRFTGMTVCNQPVITGYLFPLKALFSQGIWDRLETLVFPEHKSGAKIKRFRFHTSAKVVNILTNYNKLNLLQAQNTIHWSWSSCQTDRPSIARVNHHGSYTWVTESNWALSAIWSNKNSNSCFTHLLDNY